MGEVRKTICRMRRRKMEEINSNRGQVKELLEKARELALRESNPEPQYEYFAKRALELHSKREEIATDWELGFVFNLGCMEAALELEKDRKELETIAKELASRNSKPEPDSEYYARRALEAHKEGDQKNYDIFLHCIGWHLKKENILSRGKDRFLIDMGWHLKVENIILSGSGILFSI